MRLLFITPQRAWRFARTACSPLPTPTPESEVEPTPREFVVDRNLVGKRPTFHIERKGTSFYRIMVLLGLILIVVWVGLQYTRQEITSPFDPTATPTRTAASYFLEAQAYFDAGKLYDPSNEIPGTGCTRDQ